VAAPAPSVNANCAPLRRDAEVPFVPRTGRWLSGQIGEATALSCRGPTPPSEPPWRGGGRLRVRHWW